MTPLSRCRYIPALAIAMLAAAAGHTDGFRPEPLGQVESLPAVYPDHWLVLHDATFFHMREGRFLFVDPAADTVSGQLRGMVSADFIAHYEQSRARREHYVIESFFSRGGRGGDRTDVVTVYDAASLEVAGEIVIPPKKVSSMPEIFGTALVAGDRLLVVYNFAPGQSITVVDLEKREFVAEYPISGCALVIPTGESGVTSLCSDGSLLTTVLTAEGKLAGSHRSEPFMDAEDPMFEKAAIIDGIAYFPTFMGNVIPVDLSGEAPAPGEPWSLLSAEERASGWRPGGWQLVASDRNGRFYVLMNPEGKEGSHKDGGSEVWAFDVNTGQRVARIPLPNWGISIAVNSAEQPLLVATNGGFALETYDATSGDFIKTLAVQTQTVFVTRGMRR
ncbi:MAG: amine dehydrogenase large subunit [Gammaproteobacteria bacterium]|nr:amine dehydrogenase large subunit [Gammaproteobacteria bacterium]